MYKCQGFLGSCPVWCRDKVRLDVFISRFIVPSGSGRGRDGTGTGFAKNCQEIKFFLKR